MLPDEILISGDLGDFGNWGVESEETCKFLKNFQMYGGTTSIRLCLPQSASPPPSARTARTQACQSPHPSPRSAADAGIRHPVADNGTGVPDKLKEKIFERGFGKHMGFGLFLARKILAITGITIRKTSVPGKGDGSRWWCRREGIGGVV